MYNVKIGNSHSFELSYEVEFFELYLDIWGMKLFCFDKISFIVHTFSHFARRVFKNLY